MSTVQLSLERETARELYWNIPIDAGKCVDALCDTLAAATAAVNEAVQHDSDSFFNDDKEAQRWPLDKAVLCLEEAQDALDVLVKIAGLHTCELRDALDRALFQ